MLDSICGIEQTQREASLYCRVLPCQVDSRRQEAFVAGCIAYGVVFDFETTHESESLMNFKISFAYSRRAFTLVELLVVIAIIGILVALLLPTLGSVRESARRMQCVAMQKQLAVALKTSEQASGRLPAACFYQTTDGGRQYVNGDYKTLLVGQADAVGSQAAVRNYSPFSFFVMLLPYLDSQHLYDRVNFAQAAFDADNPTTDALTGKTYTNASLWNEPLPAVICPSYQGALVSAASDYVGLATPPAITSFKAAGATDWDTLCDALACQAPSLTTTGQGGGVLHPYGTSRGGSVTGSTILLAETRENLYAAWADGTSSCVWGLSGLGESLINRDVREDGGADTTGTYSISSEHPQMVTLCLYDGSARTMSEDVAPEVLRAMITRNASDNAASAAFLTAGN
jgi:prepilin-type N-terminal cleavage/methylation domain-containing protein